MSKLYYVRVFCQHYTTKRSQRLWGTGTLVRKSQHIQDMIWLTHQLKVIYSKMDKQYINILHAPKLDMGLQGNHLNNRLK